MKIDYHSETDSLYIELSSKPSVESQEVAGGVVLDYDANGQVRGLDFEHASERLDLRKLVLSKLPSEVTTV